MEEKRRADQRRMGAAAALAPGALVGGGTRPQLKLTRVVVVQTKFVVRRRRRFTLPCRRLVRGRHRQETGENSVVAPHLLLDIVILRFVGITTRKTIAEAFSGIALVRVVRLRIVIWKTTVRGLGVQKPVALVVGVGAGQSGLRSRGRRLLSLLTRFGTRFGNFWGQGQQTVFKYVRRGTYLTYLEILNGCWESIVS